MAAPLERNHGLGLARRPDLGEDPIRGDAHLARGGQRHGAAVTGQHPGLDALSTEGVHRAHSRRLQPVGHEQYPPERPVFRDPGGRATRRLGYRRGFDQRRRRRAATPDSTSHRALPTRTSWPSTVARTPPPAPPRTR